LSGSLNPVVVETQNQSTNNVADLKPDWFFSYQDQCVRSSQQPPAFPKTFPTRFKKCPKCIANHTSLRLPFLDRLRVLGVSNISIRAGPRSPPRHEAAGTTQLKGAVHRMDAN
ncbi:hypothetical protein RRG08_054757, partial [Elysia crispata]